MNKETQPGNLTTTLFIMLGLMLLLSPDVFASTGGGSLPWEGPLDKIVQSIKGPVAFGISVIAIVGAGVGLIMGQEISGFLKAAIMLALVISLIVLAVNVLSGAFGISGALL